MLVLQTSNMVDVVIRSVRIYKVQKSGDLHDKLDKDVNLLCEHGPQGLTIKVFTGMCRLKVINDIAKNSVVVANIVYCSRVCERLKSFLFAT